MTDAYGEKAIESACSKTRNAAQGERNDVLAHRGVALMSSEHDEADNESILVGQKGFWFDPETA